MVVGGRKLLFNSYITEVDGHRWEAKEDEHKTVNGLGHKELESLGSLLFINRDLLFHPVLEDLHDIGLCGMYHLSVSHRCM